MLRPGLELVLVGINPSSYAVEVGHYFARKQNRFWPAFSQSKLSARVRQGLQRAELTCENDQDLPRFGIGLTDFLKIPSSQAAHLKASLFRAHAPEAVQRLKQAAPRVIAFQGMMALKPFLKYGLQTKEESRFGLLEARVGASYVWGLPNPSPANATYRLQDFVDRYDELADFIARLDPASGAASPDPPR